MSVTRRAFVTRSAATLAGAAGFVDRLPALAGARETSGIRIGACVLGLEQARQAGLDGVEVGVGRPADALEIADPAVRARY